MTLNRFVLHTESQAITYKHTLMRFLRESYCESRYKTSRYIAGSSKLASLFNVGARKNFNGLPDPFFFVYTSPDEFSTF